jgi:hypothetical protein
MLASFKAADPAIGINLAMALAGDTLTVSGTAYDLADFDEVVLLGAGKASAQMAQAVLGILGGRVTGGHVVTKYDHTKGARTGPVTVSEAGHPVPDDAGVEGGAKILALANAAGRSGRRPRAAALVPHTAALPARLNPARAAARSSWPASPGAARRCWSSPRRASRCRTCRRPASSCSPAGRTSR